MNEIDTNVCDDYDYDEESYAEYVDSRIGYSEPGIFVIVKLHPTSSLTEAVCIVYSEKEAQDFCASKVCGYDYEKMYSLEEAQKRMKEC